MLKNILNLEGAQQLNKAEQRNIQGGGPRDECEALGGIWGCVTQITSPGSVFPIYSTTCDCLIIGSPNE